ncbi:MAG: hypothetical protein QM719_07010 [Thermomonas sp.]
MPALFRACLPLALLALAACSPKPAPQADAAPASPPASVAPPAPASVAVAQAGDEKCTNEPRIDENDKRPRCGGMGNPPVAAEKSGYRIDISGIGRNTGGGACHVEPITTCDITKPFSGEFCGGTLTHTPSSDKGGTFEMHVSGGGGSFTQSGSYTLSGPEERMTATYASTKLCAQAGGRTICLPPRTLSTTWTRIEDCGQ